MPLNDLQPLAFTTMNNFTMLNHNQTSSMVLNPVPEQQFCLRWNNYHSNLSNVFDQLFQAESFVDVTLIGEGRPIKAHKMVLAASSPYFQTIFQETPCKHPVVIIKDVKWEELKALVEFMYRGEINVAQEQLRPLLNLAQMFQIRGLTDVSHEDVEPDPPAPPPPVRETVPSNVEQFTVYTAASYQQPAVVQQTSTIQASDIAPRRSSKEKDFPRKQTLETMEVPVEWPKEEIKIETAVVETAAKNPRKRKSTSNDNTDGNFITLHAPEPAAYIPTTISQPISVVAPTLIPVPPLALQSAYQPEDTDSKMTTFLDTTNEADDSSVNTSQDLNSTNESRSKSLKAPAWNTNQLQEAITAVVTQRLRFTQASAQYNIPKGTLYDNILGKAHRMAVLQELALTPEEEAAVLNFCCDTATSPYNKRTKRSLSSILEFIGHFQSFRDKGDRFKFGGKPGFRWWWAFCRKHSIVSLYYEGLKLSDDQDGAISTKKGRKSADFDAMEAV